MDPYIDSLPGFGEARRSRGASHPKTASMDPPQKRRAVRYAVHLQAELSLGRKLCPAEIMDAGFGGVFVCTDLAPAVRQLVQLQVTPPSKDKRLSFHGMVVHAVSEPNPHGRKRGVGIQFYAVDEETRTVWSQFVRSIEHSSPRSQRVPVLPGHLGKALRRKFLRHAAVLRVAAPALDFLRAIHQRDLPSGRMFVACTEVLVPDDVVFVHIAHPNHAATFLLEGVVESVVREAEASGVLVRFLGLKPDRHQAFLEFIDSGLDTESDVDETPAMELGVSEVLESELEEYENMPDQD